MPNRRLVKIVIIDPDKRLEPADALVHEGLTFLTDLDDAGLIASYDEPSIRDLLKAHNAKRGEIKDVAQDRKFEKDVFLESNLDMDDLTIAVLTYVSTELV